MKSSIAISITAGAGRFGGWARLLLLLVMALVLAPNPELRAQDANAFTYVTDQNSITITGYQGAGGAVTIPATLNGLPVTKIGDYAFNFRRDLTQITLPNSLTSIGQYAFNVCMGLTQITLPDSVTSIGERAFSNCSSLTAIDVASANPNYSSAGGVLFDKGQTVVLQYPGGLPGAYTLPDSVTSIGFAAFSYCNGLTAIDVPSANPNYRSAGGVLFDKGQTVVLQYPGGRPGAYTLPDSVTSIGDSAFAGCTGLTEITLPNSLTSIGLYAFIGCRGLTQFTFLSSLTSIGNWAFAGCTGLAQISLPNSLTSIGGGTFSGCTGLTQISLPDSLTTLGSHAFSGCTGLTQISLPNSLTTLGSAAFWGCTGLTQITFPNRLTTLGGNAFSGCTGLTYARFAGNAPVAGDLFGGTVIPTVLYLPGTSGWSATFSGAPTALWLPAIGRPTTAGGLPDGSFGFPVDWAPHRQVTVESCADLTHPDWQPVGNLTLDATGTAQFSDPDSASHPNRLYRLRTP